MICKYKRLRLCGLSVLLSLLLCLCNSCQLLYVRYAETSATTGATAAAVETRDISTPPGAAPDFGIHLSDLDSGYEDAVIAASGLQKADYANTVFLLCVAEEAENTLLPEETVPMFASCAKRNALINEVYGNSFTVFTAPMETLQKDLAASVKAGSNADSYYADTLEIPAADALSLSNKGLLLSLRSLPFYQVATSGSKGAGYYRNAKNYFDVSEATYSPIGVDCLYFNTDLAGADLTEALYAAALGDGLDFETLLTAAKSVETTEIPYDICGNFSFGTFGNIAFVRAGNRYTEQVGGYPQLTEALTASDKVDALFAQLAELRWYGYTPTDAEPEPVPSSAASSAIAPAAEPNGYDMFAAGKSLFYIGKAGEMAQLTAEKCRWGILPLPGEGSAEKVERNRSVLCVSANNSRLEMTGYMLTALQKCSGDWMAHEFAIDAAQNLLRDNNSYFTLCKALEGAVFCDFAEICGSGCKNLTAATYDAVAKAMENKVAVSSLTKSLKTAVNNALKKLN